MTNTELLNNTLLINEAVDVKGKAEVFKKNVMKLINKIKSVFIPVMTKVIDFIGKVIIKFKSMKRIKTLYNLVQLSSEAEKAAGLIDRGMKDLKAADSDETAKAVEKTFEEALLTAKNAYDACGKDKKLFNMSIGTIYNIQKLYEKGKQRLEKYTVILKTFYAVAYRRFKQSSSKIATALVFRARSAIAAYIMCANFSIKAFTETNSIRKKDDKINGYKDEINEEEEKQKKNK